MKTCRHCGADIYYERGVGWVDAETDGTYDQCPDRAIDQPHAPEPGSAQ